MSKSSAGKEKANCYHQHDPTHLSVREGTKTPASNKFYNWDDPQLPTNACNRRKYVLRYGTDNSTPQCSSSSAFPSAAHITLRDHSQICVNAATCKSRTIIFVFPILTIFSLVPRPMAMAIYTHAVFQCCMLKNERVRNVLPWVCRAWGQG